MSRIFTVLFALTALITLIAGCGTDPGIIAPSEGDAAYTPMVGIYKITHHGDEVSHSYFVQADTEVNEALAVLVEIDGDHHFVVIHEGEKTSNQYQLEERVELVDAFERVKQVLPARAVGGEEIMAGYNFLQEGRSYMISENKAVAP